MSEDSVPAVSTRVEEIITTLGPQIAASSKKPNRSQLVTGSDCSSKSSSTPSAS